MLWLYWAPHVYVGILSLTAAWGCEVSQDPACLESLIFAPVRSLCCNSKVYITFHCILCLSWLKWRAAGDGVFWPGVSNCQLTRGDVRLMFCLCSHSSAKQSDILTEIIHFSINTFFMNKTDTKCKCAYSMWRSWSHVGNTVSFCNWNKDFNRRYAIKHKIIFYPEVHIPRH